MNRKTRILTHGSSLLVAAQVMKTTISRSLRIGVGLLAVTIVAIPFSARSAEIGHFNGGFMNIRDYLVPEPGFYGAVYNYFYTTERINDAGGDKIKSLTINPPGGGPGVTVGVDVDVEMHVVAPTLIWVTDLASVGLKYGALISPTFADASLNAGLSIAGRRGGDFDAGGFGAGDMLVQPVWLGKTLAHWDFALAYGFYAPVGEYDTVTRTVPLIGTVTTESSDNIGYGFWTHQVQAAAAWYPMTNKATAVVAALTYETHGEKEDFDITPGDNLTLNWGISQFLPLKKDLSLLLEIGPAGYDSWQITDDSGSGSNDTRDEVHAVGGQIGLTYVPWMTSLNFHGFYEFASQDRFQGGSFGINLAKKF